MSVFTTDGFSARVTKISPRIGDSWTHGETIWFLRPFWLNEMVILSTISKAVYWEALHQYSRSSFQSCLIWIFPWIKISGHSFFQANMKDSIDFSSFTGKRISRKLWGFSFIFSSGFTSFGVLLLFLLLITAFTFVRSFWCCCI